MTDQDKWLNVHHYGHRSSIKVTGELVGNSQNRNVF